MTLSAVQKPLAASLSGIDVSFDSVSTDSRQSQVGALFVALSGNTFDAHEFVQQAQENGAVAALVEHNVDCGLSQLKVDNTRLALGRLAALNRELGSAQVIALTGSAGKTTTKEMLAAILQEKGSVLATAGNFNNEIGVPLTLLRINAGHEYAVIEMGASRKGDIAYLMQFAKPNVALITNAMPAHIEGFGSLENVARSKAEIYSSLDEDGTAVVNLDDQFAPIWNTLLGGRKMIGFSLGEDPSATVSAQIIEAGPWYSTIKLKVAGEERELTLSVPGKHNIRNALAAVAAAYAVGVELSPICAGLEKFSGVKGRLEMCVGVQGCQLIDDSYNANPGSVKSAIDVAVELPGETWLLLGDMAELGDSACQLHQHIADYARDKGVRRMLCVGRFGKNAADSFGEGAAHFETQQALIDYCRQHLTGGEVVLVKGSRSAAMDKVVKALAMQEGEN